MQGAVGTGHPIGIVGVDVVAVDAAAFDEDAEEVDAEATREVVIARACP
ncbi:hypothetical protein K4X33_05805 [Brevibacterium casei]|nr:hypothetical protein K4X33_05805 [Brevibacterium casei]